MRVRREVAEADGGESDDREVEGVERRPPLVRLPHTEEDRATHHEDEAAARRRQYQVALCDEALEAALAVDEDAVDHLDELLDVELAVAVGVVPLDQPAHPLGVLARAALDVVPHRAQRVRELARVERAARVGVEHPEDALGADARVLERAAHHEAHHHLEHRVGDLGVRVEADRDREEDVQRREPLARHRLRRVVAVPDRRRRREAEERRADPVPVVAERDVAQLLAQVAARRDQREVVLDLLEVDAEAVDELRKVARRERRVHPLDEAIRRLALVEVDPVLELRQHEPAETEHRREQARGEDPRPPQPEEGDAAPPHRARLAIELGAAHAPCSHHCGLRARLRANSAQSSAHAASAAKSRLCRTRCEV